MCLLSDAIIPCPKTGGFRRGLVAEDLKQLFGPDVTIERAYSESGYTRGWSSLWQLPRAAMPVVAAGSVAVLANATLPTDNPAFIGIRNHEGFGWLAVNPPWLLEGQFGPIYGSAEHEGVAYEHPNPWPGSSLGSDRLSELEQFARDRAPSLCGERSRLQRASFIANRSQAKDDWETATNAIRNSEKIVAITRDISNLDELRFVLDAFISLVGRTSE